MDRRNFLRNIGCLLTSLLPGNFAAVNKNDGNEEIVISDTTDTLEAIGHRGEEAWLTGSWDVTWSATTDPELARLLSGRLASSSYPADNLLRVKPTP